MANVELIRATVEQRPILEHLLQLYIHDFSEFRAIDLDPDGRFHYPDLSLYWLEPERHPFLARRNGSLVGFALVRKVASLAGNKSVWDMAEFFVVRGKRGHGTGTELARAIWGIFPGTWQVRVMQSNKPANQFWASAVAKYTGAPAQARSYEKDGEPWNVFSFESRAD